jgi:hypothetical protein
VAFRHPHLEEGARVELTEDLDGDGVRDIAVRAGTNSQASLPALVLYVRDGDCAVWVVTLYAERVRALSTWSNGLRDIEASKDGVPSVVFRFDGFQYESPELMRNR